MDIVDVEPLFKIAWSNPNSCRSIRQKKTNYICSKRLFEFILNVWHSPYCFWFPFKQFAMLLSFGVHERYIYSREEKAQWSKEALCSWSNLPYRREEILQVLLTLYITFNPLWLEEILHADEFSNSFGFFYRNKHVVAWEQVKFVYILVVDADVEGTLLRSGLPFLSMEDSNTLCYRVAPLRTTRSCGSNENYRRQ